ncbi:hypothetical protein LTS10_010117 [Elasticomyces elasticus]|nr:hypothetical protein LTS10_010117 [Elasticomyces elasticus]
MPPRSTNTRMMARQRRSTTSVAPAETSTANELPSEQLSRLLARLKLGPNGASPQLQWRVTIDHRLTASDLTADSTPWSASPALQQLLPSGDKAPDQNSSLVSPSQIQASLSRDLAVKFNDQMLPHLQALFPTSAVNGLMLGTSENAVDLNRYSSAQVQFLIYAATNNLPGISQRMSLTSIYDYLREPVQAYFGADANQLSTRNPSDLLPCTKSMAETMFTCAIEAGDHDLIQQLLNHRELGFNVNDHICTVGDEPWTAVERSAALSHLHMTRVLIAFGADVNKTLREKHEATNWSYTDEHREAILARGALEQAIVVRRQSSSSSLDTIRLLLQAGGTFRPGYLNKLLASQDLQAVRLLIQARVQVAHQSWLSNGCFHEVIHQFDQRSVLELCDTLHDIGVDLNHQLASEDRKDVWRIARMPPRLMDIAIERGFIEVVVRLSSLGGAFSHDSMTAAVRSSDPKLVRYLLSLGVIADSYSTHFRTTPIAEAVRLRQGNIFQLLVSEGCMRDIHEEFRFCSMLASAAESDDTPMVDHLLSLDTTHKDDSCILGYALVNAAMANSTSAAIRLAEAGASLSREAYGCVLGHTTEAERYLTNPLFWPWIIVIPSYSSPDMDDKDNLATLAFNLGYRSILDRLIDIGTSVHSALTAAVEGGDLDGLRHLFSLDIGFEGDGLLSAAIKNADIVMVQELMSYGAEPGPDALVAAIIEEPSMSLTLLMNSFAAGRRGPCRASVVTTATHNLYGVFQEGVLPVPEPHMVSDWITPLGAAVLKDNGKQRETVQKLLDINVGLDRPAVAYRKGYSFSSGIRIFETALLLAVGTCEPAMVLLLLQHGANVNLPARGGLRRTPLQKAAEAGTWLVVKVLLDHGADVNAPPAERDGGTAIQLAAKGGYIGIVEVLLDAGADIQAAGSKVHGRTALEGAAEHGRYDMVKFLTLRTSFSDAQFAKAVGYARTKSHNAVTDLLLTISAEQRAQVSATQCLTCVDCNALLSNAFTLKRHQQTAHGDAVGGLRHTCRICSRVFKRKDMMDRHVEAHEGSGRVECTCCGKHFSRADTLSSHLRHCGQDQM